LTTSETLAFAKLDVLKEPIINKKIIKK